MASHAFPTQPLIVSQPKIANNAPPIARNGAIIGPRIAPRIVPNNPTTISCLNMYFELPTY